MESALQSETARAPQPKEPTPQQSPALLLPPPEAVRAAEELHPDRPGFHSLTLPLVRMRLLTARDSLLRLGIFLGMCLRRLDREDHQKDYQEDCQDCHHEDHQEDLDV